MPEQPSCGTPGMTPTGGTPMEGTTGRLKSIRQSLQETIEDDQTRRGSSTRLVMVVTATGLLAALAACITITAYGPKDLSDLAAKIIYALTGGAGGTAIAKRFADAMHKSAGGDQ